ncbi:hypothetical protein [Streptomyces sp. WG7]|uniref:hypothetical protein n=1 Tax=Streptomyces sp. WG7 TaxID=3417650 RepID=UPI003CE9CF22
MAGTVRVDPERDGIADALVVDRGEDGKAGGDGEAVEAVQDRVLDLLAGGRDDQRPVDRRAARAGAGPRHADVDRRRRRRVG